MAPKPVWKTIKNENGTILYEGHMIYEKAYGSGTAFYENGAPFHEGLFGVKGLICGREYYPNGQLRFEGTYKINRGYGPNYPEYGTWYSESGEELYNGKFEVERSGLGYPFVKKPEGYTPAVLGGPEINITFSFNDQARLDEEKEWGKYLLAGNSCRLEINK